MVEYCYLSIRRKFTVAVHLVKTAVTPMQLSKAKCGQYSETTSPIPNLLEDKGRNVSIVRREERLEDGLKCRV